ncbi:GNAT family N-acetyltransferase [Pseudovibrio sp. Tun.PSC04-5.I4]|uniref:GNAT family N-acetyltransferase n=1 Tax=Pseudovibrio sp. Tun.PSC04-5.I4 TaxID=1798213 RepID=UPI000888CFF7|nr:GNAT family N-acetyltransferase [Pseudovibrio sp. Tun.PSC04-5.I4]SDR22773.1 ribosomal-protein-alanine N-acetyltransferase [Pseudovibrio sp. Tun.PSC04-5.I4]
MNFPQLQTNRLILRAFLPDDYQRLRYLFSDFDVARMTSSFPHPLTNDSAQKLMSRFMSNDPKTNVVWAIDNGTGFIGSIGAHEIGESSSLGYALGKYYWGRGYMSEAVQAVVNYLKFERCVENVNACVFLENPASFRVLLKNGFTPTSLCKHTCVSRGEDEIDTQNFTLALTEASLQSQKLAAGIN